MRRALKGIVILVAVLVLAVAVTVGVYPPVQAQAPKSSAPQKLRVAAVGQAHISTDLRRVAPGAVEQARRYLQGADVRFTNLEAAVASKDARVTPRPPAVVRIDPDVIDCLKDMGFNLLSLSNNHALDLGEAGLRITADEVGRRGIAHAGTGVDLAGAVAPGFLETPAGRVALIGMASGGGQLTADTWAAPGHPGVDFLELRKDGTLNPEQARRILDSVREAARQTPNVIVYQHNHYWGESRGSGQPPGRTKIVGRFDTAPWLVEWAHRLIDAGASMYVGHGDPALHGVEIYKGRPILYSLGNFIFHSDNSPDVYGPLAYMSAVAHAEFQGGTLTALSFQPIVLSLDGSAGAARGTPYLAEAGEAEAVLVRLADLSRQYGTEMRVMGDSASVVMK